MNQEHTVKYQLFLACPQKYPPKIPSTIFSLSPKIPREMSAIFSPKISQRNACPTFLENSLMQSRPSFSLFDEIRLRPAEGQSFL